MNDSFSLLFVEDDADQRQLVEGWLRRVFPHVSITSVGTLAAAGKALEESRFDVVLTDLGLPDSDHDDTLPRLRSRARGASIIALTGHGEEETAMRAIQTGAEDYLVKGNVDAELLRRAVLQAWERHVLHQRMAELATFDSLTGLWNREPFREEVERAWNRAVRFDEQFALLFIDLDQFKEVNDTHGHEAGDRLLKTVSTRLQACVRRTDYVGRLGGDEFAVLLDRITDGDLEAILERMQQSVREPIDLGGASVRISASIGVARPDVEGHTLDDLFRHADAAMYQAKAQGRNRFLRFDSTLHRQLRDERNALQVLRDAVASHQFELHYQPIYDARSRKLRSFEALARWNHPSRGLLGPAAFIGDLEKDSSVVEFGRHVLLDVCRTIAACRQRGRPVAVAFNVSPREFESPQFVQHVQDALQTAGAVATDLEMEITERMLLGDVDRARRTLSELADMGVRVAIDDFGTGYSSLAYLRSLPVSALKIDQVFVQGVRGDTADSAIIHAVTQLAHTLGYRVVAEGVETERQLHEVERLGCDAWQGYLGGRPAPLDQVLRSLEGPAFA